MEISKREFYYEDNIFKDALTWLQSLGVRITSDRLSSAFKMWNTRTEFNPDHVWAISDLDDIVHYYKEFKDKHLPLDIMKLLLKIPSGSHFLSNENLRGSSNNGRDFCFELNMIRYFSSLGAIPRFDNPEADFNINLHLEDKSLGSLFFECKRPKSASSILDNLDEAMKQIEKRGAKSDSGIACLSLGRIAWEKMGKQILRGKKEDIPNFVNNLMKDELRSIWEMPNFNRNKKTIIIISEFKVPFVEHESEELLFYRHHNFFIRYCEEHAVIPYSHEFMWRASLAKIVQNSVEKSDDYK